jgi:Uri superfamily endonuclease
MKDIAINSKPGTYVLIFHCMSSQTVMVGKWGQLDLSPGFYLYVGSAFGPGGLKSRISRHFRIQKSSHWHIDYLRDHMILDSVWYSYDKQKLEHNWAKHLSVMAEMDAINGFGCSDCKCNSHFFRTVNEPVLEQFAKRIDRVNNGIRQLGFDI